MQKNIVYLHRVTIKNTTLLLTFKLTSMKKFMVIYVALMGMLAASCGSENLESASVDNQTMVPVKVHVSDFSISVEDYSGVRTRAATDVANYDGVNAITLAFYRGTTEAYKTTQLKGSLGEGETLGEFSLNLPMGSYTMVAVAYYNSEASPLVITSPTAAGFTGPRAYETFATTQTVNISNTNAVDISATLSRIIAQLKVVSTDGKTADVSNVRMTFSGGSKSFNPTSGYATDDSGFANTVSNSADVGATSISSSFLFLTTDEQNIDVTIETLDADGNTLFSKTIENVPFKRNRLTRLSGAMYSGSDIGASFQVDSDWLEQYNAEF